MITANHFVQMANDFGLTGYPPGVEHLFSAFATQYAPRPLIRRAFLTELLCHYQVGSAQTERLVAALDDIEQNEALLKLSHFFVNDLRAIATRLALDEYQAMTPSQGMRDPSLYALLLLLACLEISIQKRRDMGMPDELFIETALNPVKRQLSKLRDTGDGTIADFPWDRSFYTCDIFRIGRFYFKAERMEYPIAVYRSGQKTVAFFTEPLRVRRDGELDGVNGQFDPNGFTAMYEIKDGCVIGHPIHPAGVVEPKTVTLPLTQWKQVLRQGDIKLGLHIPAGPGYDPQGLSKSAMDAYGFFRRWFPSLDIRAFGNESWLNDPHLPPLCKPQANIPRMQKEMYNYPCDTGQSMALLELFENKPLPAPGEEATSLQRSVCQYIRQGGRLTSTCMFILPEDLPRIGNGPYAPPQAYEEVWERFGKPSSFIMNQCGEGDA